MRKVLLWIRMFFCLLPIWLSSLRSRREEFPVRFQVMKHWVNVVVNSSGAIVKATGTENIPLAVPVYFVSNHQGSLDPFIFINTVTTPCTLVSKKENLRIPIISSWMKTMEMIAFDRSDLRASLQMVKDVAEVLKNGRPVIIYPEGTRSKSSVMGEFKPGALKPAFLAKVPVVPVTMKNSYIIDVDDDDDSHIEIIYDKPIEYEEYKDMNTTELAEKVQGIIQKHLDEK